MLHIRKRIAATLAAISLITLSAATSAAASPADLEAAENTASFVTASLVDGDHLESEFGNESLSVDALLGLVAQGGFPKSVQAIVGYLQKQTPTYSGTPEGASKLALAAIAVNANPRDFAGVDLIKLIFAGINGDGSFGEYPMPYSAGLAMVVLKRAGEGIPQPLTDWLLAQQEKSGGWSYAKGSEPDADNTALAIQALLPVNAPAISPPPPLDPPIQAAVDWALNAQQADGHWEGFSPTNSTAILGMALRAVGTDETAKAADKAATWLGGTVIADNGGIPTAVGGDKGDLLTSSQALLFLTSQSYLHVSTTPPPPAETVVLEDAPVNSPASEPSAIPGGSAPLTNSYIDGDIALIGTVAAVVLALIAVGVVLRLVFKRRKSNGQPAAAVLEPPAEENAQESTEENTGESTT
ncbi:MAG: terpene cyclase/mutase family protein [Propionibacteriaceae bacterium]|nr:terpene cyclase/mutase family protein [Propionibacteriaceae bacterium]